MSKKNIQIESTRNFWSKFIKSKIIFFEKTNTNLILAELENQKKKLLYNLTDISSTKLSTEINEDLSILTSQEIEINKNLEKLNQQSKDIEVALKKTITKILDSLTQDLLPKYSNYLSSINSSLKNDVKLYINSQDEIINSVSSKELSNIIYIFNHLGDFTEYLNHNVFSLYMTTLNKRNFITSKKKKTFFRFRKLFKKMRSLRKIKRIFIFKKMKKIRSINFSFNFFNIFIRRNKNSNNNLFKRIPLSKRVVLRNNLEIFYKLHRKVHLKIKDLLVNKKFTTIPLLKKRFKIFLRNFHQKPYWKLRLARIAHWSLFTTKTLRKQRYTIFFEKFIKNYQKLSHNFFFYLNFFMKTALSWTRLGHTESFFKYTFVENTKSILKLPLFFFKKFNWSVLVKKTFFMKKRIGKWSYLNYKRSQLPWLQRKKNSPKNINHTQPNKLVLMAISSWDILSNTLFLHKKLEPFVFQTKDNFKVNWQIKLNLFRYKSNT